jgi:DNA adenine methylase
MVKPNYSKSNTYKKLYEKENLEKISKALLNTTISKLDYKDFLRKHQPHRGDFVFFDPPYFVEQVQSYYKHAFSYKDYEQLHDECKRLSNKGVKWMITVNKNAKLKTLFKDFNIKCINKYSWLSAGRGKEYEMVITNY